MKWYRVGGLVLTVLLLVIMVVVARSVPSETTIFVRMRLQTALISTSITGIVLLVTILVARRQRMHRRQQQRAAVRAQAADDHRRFVGRLDHELKNPLTAIRAGLANVTPPDGTTQETLRSIAAQTVRLSHLAADLRKLADLEIQPLETAPVNIASLIDEVVTMIAERPEAGAHHLTVLVPQAPWPLPSIAGDQDLLFLALHNLLDNALKFTPARTLIEVRAFEDGTHIVIEVADTGPGIPPDEMPYVWEELYRGAAGRGVVGSGLGLALVQTIIQRHGGQTAVRSRLGQGTVMTVRLPTTHVTQR